MNQIMNRMNMLKSVVVLLCFSISFASFAQTKKKPDKSKFLENRKFSVQFYEMKPTGRGKAVESTVSTKTGKIESPLMKEKLQIDEANFTVILDSTYTEDETEMHMVKLEAFIENKKDETKWEATIINFDIDGTVVLRKGDVDKKKFEFSGTEKTKKK